MTFDAPAGEASSASEIRTHAETLFHTYFPQWIGELNWSVQHYLEVYLPEFESPKFVAGVD
jgi:hypothetical protein